jgi:hypothetical protein
MELTKQDTKMTKGLAIIFMVLLHLFCRKTDLPYECIKTTGGVPLVYYIGLLGDCCVAIYCFCSGYALGIINQKISDTKQYYISRLKSVFKLMINYWVVLVLFSVVGLITKNEVIPGSLKSFVLNVFLIQNYNGAWWFLLTYILLVLLSKPVFAFVEKIDPIIVCVLSVVVYLPSYIQRFKNVIQVDSNVLQWIIRQLALLGTSIMPFIWGMMFCKYNVFTKIKKVLYNKLDNRQLIVIGLLLTAIIIVGHGVVQSVIVAPFTGLMIIIAFNVVDKGKVFNGIFSFFGEHSTNIWLTHMFFYSVLLEGFVFVAKYPLPIFVFMILLTLVSSYIINFIYKPISKLVK